MSVDFKKILANSLIDLSHSTPIKDIRVKDILTNSGASHQTFYNHFRSLADLYYYIYREWIVYPPSTSNTERVDLYNGMLFLYSSMKKNGSFISQLARLEGGGNLSDCIVRLESDWNKAYYSNFFPERIPEEIQWILFYNIHAFSDITWHWVRSGMRESFTYMAYGRVASTPYVLRRYYKSADTLFDSHRNYMKRPITLDRIPPLERDPKYKNRLVYSDAMIRLCSSKPLDKITVTDLLRATDTGRQTFYRLFLDKDELIQWTFKNRILYMNDHITDLYDAWCHYFDKNEPYEKFIEQAAKLTGENSLTDYMKNYSINWWVWQYYTTFNTNDVPDKYYYAARFHAYGSTACILSWASSDNHLPSDFKAAVICLSLPPQFQVFSFVKDLKLPDKYAWLLTQ